MVSAMTSAASPPRPPFSSAGAVDFEVRPRRFDLESDRDRRRGDFVLDRRRSRDLLRDRLLARMPHTLKQYTGIHSSMKSVSVHISKTVK